MQGLELMRHRHVEPSEWDALAAEPEFLQLVRARRRFIVPATIFFTVYYFALPISVGFWPDVMSRPAIGPLTWAYCFALSQFVMAWVLLGLYLLRARSFDARADAVREIETKDLLQ
jgi:uncharacterized membrane protein (DUF485 family)